MANGWHSPTGSRTQEVRSDSPRVLRPARRDLEHHASRKTCEFLSQWEGESTTTQEEEEKQHHPKEGMGEGWHSPPAKGERDSSTTQKQKRRKQHHPQEEKEGSTDPKREGNSLSPSFFWAAVLSPPRCSLLLLMVLPSSASFGWPGHHLFLNDTEFNLIELKIQK